jgi:hypothetical protein
MSGLLERVEINRRFARSARIDADLKGTPPLIGYVLQASVAKALTTLAAAQIESRQGAFTWTGPYGGGKSSAALLIANLVAGADENRKIAKGIAGKALTAAYGKAFGTGRGPWDVVAVTGSRVRLRDAIVEAAAVAFGWSPKLIDKAKVSDEALIDLLVAAASKGRSGVLLILDELGKLLEHEALEGGDVHLLQDLAERASRSEGRLVVIGILHQSFEQYAARAARDARQEWAKVQGRFQDIAFLSGADETVALLGQAISADGVPHGAAAHAEAVAAAVAERRPTDKALLSRALAETWPLNPVTALLLGPVSRQRFAQNERSVFGFLSSAEPSGFQEFLAGAEEGETYDPARLWDYLSSNFGMALASGSDGARFSLAFEAIERAAAKGSVLHVELTKAAAVIEFFRNGSGLALADDILEQAVPGVDQADRANAIRDLLDWAVFIRQPRLGGYALFAGSDFDLEEAISRAIGAPDDAVLGTIPQRVGFGFATAKRHYFATGALRTFDIVLQQVGERDDLEVVADALIKRKARGSGFILLLLNDGTLDKTALDRGCAALASALHARTAVAAVGAVVDSYALRDTAAELDAVERVFREHPQLEGDRIARREIAARQSSCIDRLHRTLEEALENARWRLAPTPDRVLRQPLSMIASALADEGYPSAPILRSELLQRDRPSSNSMAALRELGHAMVSRAGDADLGFKGYPAEMGLYLTVLKPFGLHAQAESGFDFREPDDSLEGRSLRPAWAVLDEQADAILADIYAIWRAPPYGLKDGVMPVIVLAYLMANRDRMAVYIEGIFQTAFNDFFVDRLLQRPGEVRLRRIDRSVREAAFLNGIAALLEVEDEGASLPVAQALYQRFESLPPYGQRTNSVGEEARLVRGVVLKSRDPEALLFDDLPEALGDRLSADLVFDALGICEAAYPKLLEQLRAALARAVGVDVETLAGIAARAETVKELTNDYAFEAFAMRAAAFDGGDGDIEGLASLLLHKPAQNWSDRDRDQALIEMARFGRRFRELEALAVVRDRRSNTEALALIVGVDPMIPPLLQSFELTDREKKDAAALAEKILGAMGGKGLADHVRMAALARAVAALAADQSVEAEAA